MTGGAPSGRGSNEISLAIARLWGERRRARLDSNQNLPLTQNGSHRTLALWRLRLCSGCLAAAARRSPALDLPRKGTTGETRENRKRTFGGYRIVKCHASMDVVIDVRIVECHASIHVVIGIRVVPCHPLVHFPLF